MRRNDIMFDREFIFLISISFLSIPLAYAKPDGQWKVLPTTPSKRTEIAVTILDNNIYVVGGFTQNGISNQVEVLDGETKKWSVVAPLPRPLHHTTASAVNGKLYVIGGFTSGMWTPVRNTYEYNPKKDVWTEKASMPTKRGALAATVIGGKIFVVGGVNKKMFALVNTPALEVYDPFKNTWTKLVPMPTPRDHLTVSSLNKKLYAIGGRVNLNFHQNLDTNEVYDPKTNSWTSLMPMPTKRSGITSQILNKRILVFGGESGKATFKENEAYNPNTDTWIALKPMPTGRHGLGSVNYKNTIHLFGGGPNPGRGGSNTHMIFSMEEK